jgi:hypothetical protein
MITHRYFRRTTLVVRTLETSVDIVVTIRSPSSSATVMHMLSGKHLVRIIFVPPDGKP